MSFLSPLYQPWFLAFFALITAFFSATQDIAYNAYTTDVLQAEERGLGAAWGVMGYRLAMLTSGGLSFILADKLGWQNTYQIMAALMALTLLASVFAPRPQQEVASALLSQDKHNFISQLYFAIRELSTRMPILLILLFVILYKLGDALALTLTSPFLIRYLGFSQTDVGVVFKVFGLFATLLGVFIGGGLLTKMKLYKGLMIFGLLQAFSNLMFMLLALVGKNAGLMAATVFTEQLCSGLGTAAFVAFIMSLCNIRYTASQFALLTALASLGRICMGPISALMVAHMGWANFYFTAFLFSLPGLFLLYCLKNGIFTELALPESAKS